MSEGYSIDVQMSEAEISSEEQLVERLAKAAAETMFDVPTEENIAGCHGMAKIHLAMMKALQDG